MKQNISYFRFTVFVAFLHFIFIFLTSIDTRAQNKNAQGVGVGGARPPDSPSVPGKPLETWERVGKNQKPAFAGQTRAGSVVTKTPIKVEVITSQLHHP